MSAFDFLHTRDQKWRKSLTRQFRPEMEIMHACACAVKKQLSLNRWKMQIRHENRKSGLRWMSSCCQHVTKIQENLSETVWLFAAPNYEDVRMCVIVSCLRLPFLVKKQHKLHCIQITTSRSQHSQECRDPCHQCLCDSWHWPLTFWPIINGFPGVIIEHFCVKSRGLSYHKPRSVGGAPRSLGVTWPFTWHCDCRRRGQNSSSRPS